MDSDEVVFRHFTVCSERFLNAKLLELPQYGWAAEQLEAMKIVWEQVKEMGTEPVTINPGALQNAIKQGIVRVYDFRWWHPCFENCRPTTSPFSPPPGLPVLYSCDRREMHYLHGSRELREITLQLWLYCDQDANRFNRAIATVWREYSQYSKFDCGYPGETDKFAAALRRAADS